MKIDFFTSHPFSIEYNGGTCKLLKKQVGAIILASIVGLPFLLIGAFFAGAVTSYYFRNKLVKKLEQDHPNSTNQKTDQIGKQLQNASPSNVPAKDQSPVIAADMLVEALEEDPSKEIDRIFQDLLQKAKKVVSAKKPELQGNPDFNNFQRYVIVGYDKNGAILVFIKWPCGKYQAIQEKALKNEQLAFLISHALEFNVVPPTIVTKLKMDPKCRMASKMDCVVQSAVHLADKQTHLLEGVKHNEMDLSQIHQLILFNMIVGRHDGRPCNTVLDKQNRFIEVDNESLGFESTDSWLLEEFERTVLSKELVKNFLTLEEITIKNVFLRMKADSLTFDESVQKNILSNFAKIKHLFATYSADNREIRVRDLMKINRS